MKADIPGYDPKKINVEVSDRSLGLSAEQSKENQEEKKGKFYKVERSHSSFQRVIPLPCEVLTDKVSAQAKNGILTVVLPKKVVAAIGKKKIPIEEA